MAIFLEDYSKLDLMEVFKCLLSCTHGLSRGFSRHAVDNDGKQ